MRPAGEGLMLTARAREQSKLERTNLNSVALAKDDELGKIEVHKNEPYCDSKNK